MKHWNRLSIALFILSNFSAQAQEAEFSATQEIKTYLSVRKLNQNFDPVPNSTDLVLIGSSNMIAQFDHLRLEARPEVRLISGNNNILTPTSPSVIHLESPERAFETRFHLGELPDQTILYGDWEKLNLSYSQDGFEAFVGRKVVSLGVMKYFPVWNKFSRPLPGVTLIPIYFGSDGLGGRAQFSNWSIQANQLYYNLGKDQVSIAEVTHYGEFADLHALLGSWWNQTVFGFAASKDVAGATLNLEFFHYGSGFQFGAGLDRALSEKVTLNVETLYQSEGADSTYNYNPLLISHFQTLQANFYSWLVLQYQFNSLLKGSAGGLTNWVDGGTALNLGLTYSLSDQFDLSAECLTSLTRSGAEFSNQSFQFSDGTHFGMPTQLVVHLDWTF